MSRVAVVVGVNHYPFIGRLNGSVDDAKSVTSCLEQHQRGDQQRNFEVHEFLSESPESELTKSTLRHAVRTLFSAQNEVALFYFAGHGSLTDEGGYLMSSDSQSPEDGLPLDHVVEWAMDSPATHRIIVLDCCHSGSAGDRSILGGRTMIAEGVTILAASARQGEAFENQNGGVFTTLFCDALNGAAANLLGEVTPGSVYAHIDQSLGKLVQRPVFKTNVQSFVSLRDVSPPIALADLRKITSIFENPDEAIALDPSFEPERPIPNFPDAPEPDEDNTKVFATLQAFNHVNLVVPVDAPHMWHAAVQSKSARLTTLGQHYWRLVKSKRI
mmetsp:Transcript_24202/g.45051  ORF Transcript_24202/g.45051 Transcript_24202/m.45051 type:complete len:329 (+) Transcript_24202:95-1081(+)